MAEKPWQPHDKVWKILCDQHADSVLEWLEFDPKTRREKVRVESLRTEARAPDTVFVLETKPRTILIIECEFALKAGMENRLLTAIGALRQKFGEVNLEAVVIGFTGSKSGLIRQENRFTRPIFEYRTIALQELDAESWVGTKPTDLLPLVSLLKGCDASLLEKTAVRILNEGTGRDTLSSLQSLLTLAGARFSKEVIMSLGEVLNQKNTYLELKRAEEEALVRRGREEGREEGLTAQS